MMNTTMHNTVTLTNEEANSMFGDLDFVNDWNAVKGKIFLGFLPAGRDNAAQDLVGDGWCNLGLHYYYYIPITEAASVKVTNSLLNRWKTNGQVSGAAEVYMTARENTAKETRILDMQDTLVELMTGEPAPEATPEKDHMILTITNKTKAKGAAAMMCDTIMDRVCQILRKETVMILPSSIHEILAVNPDTMSVEQAVAMVKKINANEVEEHDRLADTVFFYNIYKGMFTAEEWETYMAEDENEENEEW